MYSSAVIEQRLSSARKAGFKFNRVPRGTSIGISKELEALRHGKNGRLLPDGQLSRSLAPDEQEFIDSERILCKADFEYFFLRYYHLRIDPGVGDSDLQKLQIGPVPFLLESQRQYISLLGKKEEECAAELRKYKFTQGIHAYFHKVRQVAATATARALSMHRMVFYPGSTCFAASLDEPRIGELFTRDHLALDRLPWWLRPQVYPDVKDTELGFGPPIDSRCLYQAENQQQGRGGLGVGTQNLISHLTEVSLWQNPGYIEYSFWPAVPKSFQTLHIQESTANGKGNYWYVVTEAARHKKRGFEHWVYAFIPWWFNKTKWRANVPDDWRPEDHTVKHAELIERTSPEFNAGITYHPNRSQLYWWEKERASHVERGALAEFLTNYPATPMQSFQNPQQGALPPELIEKMEQRVCVPEKSFDYEIAAVA